MSESIILLASKLIETGYLNSMNPEITDERFNKSKRRWKNYEVFHFKKRIASEDAEERMLAEGYKSANAPELLLWKRWDRKYPVVALGSVGEVAGERFVLCFDRFSLWRSLCIDPWNGHWAGHCRFLGTRKSSPGS